MSSSPSPQSTKKKADNSSSQQAPPLARLRRHLGKPGTYGGGPPSKGNEGDADAKLIENERWKYLATFFNTVAAAAIAVGVITPVSAVLIKGPAAITEIDAWVYVGMILIWIGVATALHLSVQRVLGNLRS